MAPSNQKAEAGSAAKAVDASQQPLGPLTVAEDLDALRNEIAELERASHYRSLFLSRLAHELRTPLTSILGFSEILLNQEKLTEAQRGFCERIQSSARQLQSYLNQLSDLARLETGETKLAEEKISLPEILRDVLPALARSAGKKRVRLMTAAPDDLPAIISDRSRVRLVIYNLLSYAISRSPEGAVVKAEVKATTEGVSITIIDNGDPVADPSQIGILQTDENSSTGDIALSIARQNVELLGGSIVGRNLEGEVEVAVNLALHPGPPSS